MTKTSEIQQFCDALAKSFKPNKIILFGSYARGKPRADSDVDLLITMPRGNGGAEVAGHMIEVLKPRFAVDLIVRTEADVKRRLKQRDYFLQQAMREGRVVYEASHA